MLIQNSVWILYEKSSAKCTIRIANSTIGGLPGPPDVHAGRQALCHCLVCSTAPDTQRSAATGPAKTPGQTGLSSGILPCAAAQCHHRCECGGPKTVRPSCQPPVPQPPRVTLTRRVARYHLPPARTSAITLALRGSSVRLTIRIRDLITGTEPGANR